MSVLVAVPLFVGSLVVTLAAARLFAQRLDRLGTRFGFPEALIGLLTALAADGPEISTALVALFKGAHGVSVGVLVGSNVFNLAAMIGLSAMVVGSVRVPRDVLGLEGAVSVIATMIAAGVLLGWLPALVAVILVVIVLVPYLVMLTRQPDPRQDDRRTAWSGNRLVPRRPSVRVGVARRTPATPGIISAGRPWMSR